MRKRHDWNRTPRRNPRHVMAEPRSQKPVLLVVAAFSSHAGALAWARDRLAQSYGPISLASHPFDFHHTEYYRDAMGPDLRKQFFAFENLVDPDCLPAVKHHTNRLEETLAGEG